MDTIENSIAIKGNFCFLTLFCSKSVYIIVGNIINPVKLRIHSISIVCIYFGFCINSEVIDP